MIDNKTISSLRMLSVDMIEKAKSGHPGLPLGSAPMLYTLYKDFLKSRSGLTETDLYLVQVMEVLYFTVY